MDNTLFSDFGRRMFHQLSKNWTIPSHLGLVDRAMMGDVTMFRNWVNKEDLVIFSWFQQLQDMHIAFICISSYDS